MLMQTTSLNSPAQKKKKKGDKYGELGGELFGKKQQPIGVGEDN